MNMTLVMLRTQHICFAAGSSLYITYELANDNSIVPVYFFNQIPA